MRNQAVKTIHGNYRGQVTCDGRVIASTLKTYPNRNAAVIGAWLVLLAIRNG